MKQILIIFIFFLSINSYSQLNKLIADVNISLEKGIIDENVIITNFQTSKRLFEILLSKSLKINSIKINNTVLNFKIDSTRNSFQNIYSIKLKNNCKINDSIKIKISGKFKIYNDTNKYLSSSNVNIVSNYNILRAPPVTSWYPQIKNGKIIEFAKMYAKKYNYNITVNCPDCKYIQIGDKLPSKTPYKFEKEYGSIMLLAGNYDWKLYNNIVFINIDSSKIESLYKLSADIRNYFEKLFNQPINNKIFFARLYTDKDDWAFFATPTIVFMKPKNKKVNIDIGLISHEIAHNYFGNLYLPKTNLYWFYLESFAEFYSLKYQISKNHFQVLKNKYQTLKMASLLNRFFVYKINDYDIKFVRLDKVKNQDEITEFQRYNISPFQLLGIENIIGEKKMIEFTKKVFINLQEGEDGYKIMFETLRQIGVSEKDIKTIEKNYFKKLKFRKYKFIKENWLKCI